jgi:hypothetical protein
MADRELERVRKFTRVMDRFGLDPILGFVFPAVGDLVGSALGLYIVGIAIKRRLPKVAIARMLLNLGIDMVVGIIPFIGDAADVAFKANERNLRLLEGRTAQIGRTSTAGDWAVVLGAVLAFIAAIGAVVWAIVFVARKLA